MLRTAKSVMLLCTVSMLPALTRADGVVVDKVYHPYVLPNEREVEWRIASDKTDGGNRLMQRIGFGHSLSESLTTEIYAIGERDEKDDFEFAAFEIEARWMLTEQGEKWADWGMLFELERDLEDGDWEASAGILAEKEFGRTSLTVNLFSVFEWGETVSSEWETEFRLKYRYRWIPQIQPAIEIYTGENYVGAGPAVMGIQRFDGQKQLKWEAGIIEEIGHGDIGRTFRLALEYEF